MLEIFSRRLRSATFIAVMAIIILSFLSHGAGLWNGFALLDDGLLIFENNLVREISSSTLRVIFTSFDPELYIPLTFLTYQIEYLIAGYNPFVFHLTNLLLHTVNALMVFAILRELPVVRKNCTYPSLLALVIALLFAIHPMHVETVAWASARKDVLSGFFFLFALFAYCVSRSTGVGRGALGVGASRVWYWVSVGTFLLALLAKVTVVTLPVILILIDWSSGKFRRPFGAASARAILEKVPFLLLSILFGVVAILGKTERLVSIDFFEQTLLACKMIFFAIFTLIFPFNLSVFYPVQSPISITTLSFLISFFAVPVLAGALVLFRKNRTLLFGMLFFLCTLAPAFFTAVKGGNVFLFSDRYAYLPSIGLLLAIGSLIINKRWFSPRFAASIFGAVCILFIMISIRQTMLWGDNVKLFRRAIAYEPNFYLGYINLGASLRLIGESAGALEAFQKAIQLHPLANTHALAGQVEAEQGDFASAMKEFETAIAMDPADPELHYGVGQVLALMGEADRALAEYERALALASSHEGQYRAFARRIASRRDMIELRIGILLGTRGDHAGAISHFERAIEENPWNDEAHYNLAVALGNLDRIDEAIRHYESAISINSENIAAKKNLDVVRTRTRP